MNISVDAFKVAKELFDVKFQGLNNAITLIGLKQTVDALPAEANPGDLYLVGIASNYDGYVFTLEQKWEYVGPLVSDLIGRAYVDGKVNELNDALQGTSNQINDLNNSKAEKQEVLYSNDTPVSADLGGIAKGSVFSDVPITEMLTKLLYPHVPPEIIIQVNGINSNSFEKGTSQTITNITTTIIKKSVNITKVELFYVNAEDESKTLLQSIDTPSRFTELNTIGEQTFLFEVNLTAQQNFYFYIAVTDAADKTTIQKTKLYSFYRPYYYGSFQGTISEVSIKNRPKGLFTGDTLTLNYSVNDNSMLIAVPKAVKTILDNNGFNMTNTFKRHTINITCLDNAIVEYQVYLSKPTTVSNFQMKFIF